MPKKGSGLGRKPDCHPDRTYFANGLCHPCYDRSKYIENIDKVKERTSRYAKEHPELFNEWSKQYQLRNPEKVIERRKKYNKENAEKILIRSKAYRDSNLIKVSERHKKYYVSHPEKERAKRLKKYGMTIDDYEAMFAFQNGLCAICESDNNGKKLHVDHDHNTGKVRQLLCNSCNIGLGMLKDDVSVLERATIYLRKHKQ